MLNQRSILALMLPAMLMAGCGRKAEPPPRQTAPPVPVRLQTAEVKTRVASEDVVGTVRARLRAVVEAKVSGRIETMLAVPGRMVDAGDLLAQLDARETKAQLDRALALRQQASNDLARFTALLRDDTVTRAEFDTVEARSRVAEAAVIEAETMLGYTKISAPFAGVITRKYADVGDLAVPGKPLAAIEDPRTLRFEADVPEALAGGIRLGDRFTVTVPAAGRTIDAVAGELSPAADPNSRTFLVKFDLPRVDGLRAGQFGRVAVPFGRSEALRVPAGAVLQRGQMELVFVAVDGRAQLRLVKTGKRIGDEVELLSGISGGEQVVIEGAPLLQDGRELRIVN